METGHGRILRGVGGLYTVRLDKGEGALDGRTVFARGRGALRRKGELLVGDRVTVSYEAVVEPSNDGSGIAIDEMEPRSCALIRPPMANLNVLFVTVAAAEPEPSFETVDKLISIAEFNKIESVIVITKSELSPESAEKIEEIYQKSGFSVFRLSNDSDVSDLQKYIHENLAGKVAAFSGASGVGKSTMLNKLFPNLHLETGELSHRIERGKNTTRNVELYPLGDGDDCGYLADTPGFSMLDFERFDFFEKEDLPLTFREFSPYIGKCRYTTCTHTKEEDCAIVCAVKAGKIAASRHKSFVDLYETLKKKTKW